MDQGKILAQFKSILDLSNHPQINKSDIKLIDETDKKILGCYLNNVLNEESSEDENHVLTLNLFDRGEYTYLFLRIMNIYIDTRFFSEKSFESNYFINQVLLDLPSKLGSTARFYRSYDEEANIEIHQFSRVISEDNLKDNDLFEPLSDSLRILNQLIFVSYQNKLKALKNILSEAEIENKITTMHNKMISWSNFEEDKI